MRFGSEYVETALAAQARRQVVADADEVKDDLAPDMVEVLRSFCARLYGRRSAQNPAKKALAVMARRHLLRPSGRACSRPS
jgi:putative resolvase